MLPKTVYWSLLILVCALAAWRGRREEWFAASICAVGSILTTLVSRLDPDPIVKVQTGVMVIDLVALGAFTAIALVSQRFWPLWVAGFQLASSMAHALRALNADLIPRAYAAAERFWIYPIFVVIVVGAFRAHRLQPMPPREPTA